MPTELPTGSVAAIATIVAALIAAAISFVNLTLNKEQKTSEFRQAWIDALREDLAAFFASTRAFVRASQEQKASLTSATLPITEQKVSDLRYQVAETKYRIQLRLNTKEPEHTELLRLMQSVLDKQQAFLAGSGEPGKALEAVEVAASYAPHILKLEWERVKRGELPFRVARNWVAPFCFIAAIIVLVLLWAGKLSI